MPPLSDDSRQRAEEIPGGSPAARVSFGALPIVADEDGRGLEIAPVDIEEIRPMNAQRLAKDMGQRRSWIGISAFLVFACAFRLRIGILVFGRIIDLLREYLTAEMLPQPAPAGDVPRVVAIGCIIENDGHDGTSLRFPVDEAESVRINHWVRSVVAPSAPAREPHAPCQGVLCHGWGIRVCASALIEASRPHGLLPIPSQSQGDCGVHCMCDALGWVGDEKHKLRVRITLEQFLLDKVRDPSWHAALVRCGEELDDVPAIALGGEVASAIVPAIGIGECSSGIALSEEMSAGEDGRENLAVLDDVPMAVDAENLMPDEAEDAAAGCDLVASLCRGLDTSKRERAWIWQRLSMQEKQALREAAPTLAPASGKDRRPDGDNDARRSAQPGRFARSVTKAARRKRDGAGNHSTLLKKQAADGAAFAAWCKANKYDLKKRLPRETTTKFVSSYRPSLLCMPGRKYQQYLHRCLKNHLAGVFELDGGSRRGRGAENPQRVEITKRRRLCGTQGRPKKAVALRQNLFEWFCEVRGSIAGRIPVGVLRRQAQALRTLYIAECLRQREVPDAPKTCAGEWLRRWRREYGVSLRKPNRRFKVPRATFMQRCRIAWCNMLRVRVLMWLEFGYEPTIEGFDQKPFHMSESGSKNQATLALRGEPDVKLKENHTETRQRWSANTFVVSCEDCAERIPPLEACFRGGTGILKELEDCRPLHCPFLSMQTSPKGSYRIEHILECLEKHFPPATREGDEAAPAAGVEADANMAAPVASAGSEPRERRCQQCQDKWRIMTCDIYTGHDEKALRHLLWKRCRILIQFGGGTTGFLQVNDTKLHYELSKDYQELEQEGMLADLEVRPMGCPKRCRSDCVADLACAWSRAQLHRRAAGGHLENHLSNALDGSEDHKASRKVAEAWEELGMPQLREQIIEEVCTAWERGELRWTFEDVYSLVQPFPKTGFMDSHDANWDRDSDDDDADDDDPWDDDPGNSPAMSEDEGGEAPVPAGSVLLPSMDVDVAEEVARHEASLRSMDAMVAQAREHGDPALLNHLQRARVDLLRNVQGARQADARVAAALRQAEQDRRASLRQRQREEDAARRLMKRHKKDATELDLLADELRKQQADLRRKEKDLLRQETAAVSLMRSAAASRERQKSLESVAKDFDDGMFGQGKRGGGSKENRDHRLECLERIKRSVDALPAELEVNWDRFKARRADSIICC